MICTLTRAVVSHNGVHTRQLMKTRHCWQHHEAHSAKSGPFYFYSFHKFPPTWIQYLSVISSSTPSASSLSSYPLSVFFFLLKLSRTCVTPSMWCRFGIWSHPPNWNVLYGTLKAYQWDLSGLFPLRNKKRWKRHPASPPARWAFHLDITRNRSWSGQLFPQKDKMDKSIGWNE